MTADLRPRIVVVAGPTAVGKTRLAIDLALRFNGQVVNADSRYLYRGLDIGTAKPTPDEQQGVPHHLIDILDPRADFSLATYQELANAAIADVIARGRLPILTGGTPLYINAVVEGWRIPRVPPHPVIRARLEAEAAANGVAPMAARLAIIDPVAAARCGTNTRRIIRALEIHEVTGERMSDLEGKGPRPYRALELGVALPRFDLHRAIDLRVRDQIRRGLVGELRALLAAGIPRNAPAFSSLGYRQLFPFLAGAIDLESAIRQIMVDTHRYVRHQETWLRKNPRLRTIDATAPDWIANAADLVGRFLAADLDVDLARDEAIAVDDTTLDAETL